METLALERGDNNFQIAESKQRAEREVAPLLQEVANALRERESGEVVVFDDRNGSNRTDLFSGAGGGGGYNAPNLDGNDDGGGMMESLIQDSDDLLLESQALCAESEQIGSGTLNTMGMQREQLHSASDHLRGARSTVEQASFLLQDMHRKNVRNKRFLYCIIAALILANFLVIIAIIKKHTKK